VSLFAALREQQESLLERAFSMEPITAFGKLVEDSLRHHAFVSKAVVEDSASHAAAAPPRTTDSDVANAGDDLLEEKTLAQMAQSE
jgi:hypothetical protein